MEEYIYLLGKDKCLYRTKDEYTYEIYVANKEKWQHYDGDDICFYKDYKVITKEQVEEMLGFKIIDSK